MYLTVKQQIKHLSKNEYETLREYCHIAKNLTNETIYAIRQYYFSEGKYLSFYTNCKELKYSPNYKAMNSNMAQQILKEVDGSFKSFFALLKLAKQGQYDFKACKIPQYLDKDGFATLVIAQIRIKDNIFVLPYSNQFKKNHSPIKIKIPPILNDKVVKEIRIIPKSNAKFFEIQYIYKADCSSKELNINNALALDFGVDNLITAVSNNGNALIVDGRKLKSINQWYNKENTRLQSIKGKQKIEYQTNRQYAILNHRNNKVNDYLSKSAKYVVNYCIDNDIGTLIVGYNKDFQLSPKMGKVNNQIFVNISYGKLKDKLKYLCELNNIRFIEQEESYTSKASFWDKDYIPEYGDTTIPFFSGKRIHRGMYKTSKNVLINADVNGALNIMRKSKVVDLNILYCRGEVDTPLRIKII